MPITDTQALARLRARLNEKGITSGTWDDQDLYAWLDEGQRDVARRTLCLTDQRKLSLVAGTNEYTIPADVLRIFRCEFIPGDGRRTPLTARAYNAMDSVWWSDQDRVRADPLMYTTWGNSPGAKLKLYPTPNASVTDGLRLFVARMPAPLPGALTGTGVGMPIDLPEAWVELAIDYAEYCALRRDRQTDIMAEVKAAYESRIGDITSGGLTDPGTGMTDANDEMVFDGPWPLPRWLVDPSFPY